MSIIIFIILFILVAIIIGLSFVISIVRSILSFLGLGRSKTGGYYNTGQTTSGSDGEYRRRYGNNRQQESGTSGWHYSPEAESKRKKRKKIFEANEGEYVDFEEVK